jgi:DNA-binding transcriptional LysR family regulator
LYDLAARIPAGREAAEDDGMVQSTAPRGHVRLTAPMSYGLVRVAPIRPEFLERYPAVTIDLHLCDSHVSGRDTTPPFASIPAGLFPDRADLVARIALSRGNPQAISQVTAA